MALPFSSSPWRPGDLRGGCKRAGQHPSVARYGWWNWHAGGSSWLSWLSHLSGIQTREKCIINFQTFTWQSFSKASLTSDLSLQKLALHLECYEAATDQKQSQSTISLSSQFLERLPLSGTHHFTPFLVLNNHHNLCKHGEHSKMETSIFFISKLNQTE